MEYLPEDEAGPELKLKTKEAFKVFNSDDCEAFQAFTNSYPELVSSMSLLLFRSYFRKQEVWYRECPNPRYFWNNYMCDPSSDLFNDRKDVWKIILEELKEVLHKFQRGETDSSIPSHISSRFHRPRLPWITTRFLTGFRLTNEELLKALKRFDPRRLRSVSRADYQLLIDALKATESLYPDEKILSNREKIFTLFSTRAEVLPVKRPVRVTK